MSPWDSGRTVQDALIAKLGRKGYGQLLDKMMAIARRSG